MLPLLLAAAVAAEPVELIVTSEPLGAGDDRTATAIEDAVRAQADAWLACWATHARPDDPDALRFLQITLWPRTSDGTVRKAKVSSSTANPELDACGALLGASMRIEPRPVYPAKMLLNVTWARPAPPTPP